MAALTPIETAPKSYTPTAITEAEAAATFRACVNLFARWGLSDQEAATLLDTAPRTYARWKAGAPGRIGRDQQARLSNLMGIHKALRLIFRDPARAYAWVRLPNQAFGMTAALDIMLHGELTDIMRVRHYLDAERGA